VSSDHNLRVRGCNDDHIDVIGAHNERQQDRHKYGDGNGENAGKKWGGGRMTTRSGGVCHKAADGEDRDNDDGSKKKQSNSKHKVSAGMGQWLVVAKNCCGGRIEYPPFVR